MKTMNDMSKIIILKSCGDYEESDYIRKVYITDRDDIDIDEDWMNGLKKECQKLAEKIGVKVIDFNVKKGTDKEKSKEWKKAYANLYKYYTVEYYIEQVLKAKPIPFTETYL